MNFYVISIALVLLLLLVLCDDYYRGHCGMFLSKKITIALSSVFISAYWSFLAYQAGLFYAFFLLIIFMIYNYLITSTLFGKE